MAKTADESVYYKMVMNRQKGLSGFSMRMRLLMVSLVVVIVLLAASLLAAPRLVIPETEFDFGFVPQNSKITHYFWLESKGDDSLKIIQVVPG